MGALAAPPVRLIGTLHESLYTSDTRRYGATFTHDGKLPSYRSGKGTVNACFIYFSLSATWFVPRFTKQTSDTRAWLRKSAHRPVLGLSAKIRCATVAGLRFPGGPSQIVFHNCGRNCGNPGRLHEEWLVCSMRTVLSHLLGSDRGLGNVAPLSDLIWITRA